MRKIIVLDDCEDETDVAAAAAVPHSQQIPHPTNIAKMVFYNNTWAETQAYLAREDCGGAGFRCIYGSTVPFKKQIGMDEILLVFEMNNQTNKIMGFGIIPNRVYKDRRYRVYTGLNEYMNFNIYKGRHHVSRDAFVAYQAPLDATGKTAACLLEETERMMFCGRTHHKRGVGMRIMSDERMPREVKAQFYRVVMDILKEGGGEGA